MCKLFVFVLFSIALASPIPTAEQANAELVNAGVSAATASQIITIGQKYRDQFMATKSDKEGAKATYAQFNSEVDAYMKTQSAADQTAYTGFLEKKKAEYEARAEVN